MTLKSLLKDKLNQKQLKHVPTSFDIIGSRERAVAVIKIPDELRKKKKIIANALMKKHKNVVSVLDKKSPRKGVYRTREYELIAGKKSIDVVHRESGCRFVLNPLNVYFSPRESAERLRIAEKVKPGEIVMIFFAGIGPFAIVMAKKSKPEKIIGIEINPEAVRYFRENVKLNKTKNLEIVLGDVRAKAKKYHGQCNRVLMPLPESAHEYLEDAIKCLKPEGVCHFYCFAKENEANKWKNKIKIAAKGVKRKIKFLGVRKVLQWGPGIWKIRIDFIVS